jgi:hypothetical protein
MAVLQSDNQVTETAQSPALATQLTGKIDLQTRSHAAHADPTSPVFSWWMNTTLELKVAQLGIYLMVLSCANGCKLTDNTRHEVAASGDGPQLTTLSCFLDSFALHLSNML